MGSIQVECHTDRKHFAKGLCQLCYQRAWRLETPQGKAYRERQQPFRSKWQEKHRNKRKTLALFLLGNKCMRCGFDDPRALQIDHINGGGEKARQHNRSKSYVDVTKGLNLHLYQLLCANCNCIKRIEQKEN